MTLPNNIPTTYLYLRRLVLLHTETANVVTDRDTGSPPFRYNDYTDRQVPCYGNVEL